MSEQTLSEICRILRALVDSQINESRSTSAVASVLSKHIENWDQKYRAARQSGQLESQGLSQLQSEIDVLSRALEVKKRQIGRKP
jgi:hypothetical protein